MKKILFCTLALLMFVSVGCDDEFLDREPYDGLSSTIIWTTDANAILGVNGMYNSFAQTSWYDPYYYLTTLAPEGYTVVRAAFGLSHMTGLATPRDAMFLKIYTSFYKTIRYANDVIAGLSNNTQVSEALATRLVGEAKFMRGLSYFYLWQLYGGVPLLLDPLPVDETYLPRSTAEEVKNQIIADFTDAALRLPVTYPAADKGRAERGAAIAMLGKTYLYDQQWALAAGEFEKLLTTPYAYKLTANFDDNFYWQTQMNSEMVFSVQYVSQPDLGSDIDTRYGFRNHPRIGQDYATASQISVDIFTNKDGSPISKATMPVRSKYANEAAFGRDLINWYQQTYANADPRLHKSVILPGSTFVGGLGVTYKLYWPTGSNNENPPAIRTTFPNDALIPIRKFVSPAEDAPVRRNSPVDFPIVRFADVLLMYAEAKNEAEGPSASVYDALNKVRTRAGVVNFATGQSKEELRRNIRLERFRELLFEAHGYLDVRRWRTAHTTDPIFGLNHEVLDFRNSRLLTKVFKEGRDYLWPIPGEEIDLNKNITQNPGY